MDPNACWDRIVNAISENEESEAIYALTDLIDWLKGGGFPPRQISPAGGDGDCTAEFICQAVLDKIFSEE